VLLCLIGHIFFDMLPDWGEVATALKPARGALPMPRIALQG
jgi:hypothetical protein